MEAQANTYPTTARPADLIAIGAGNRMHTYIRYLEQHPEKARLVAVVEPDPERRDSIADRFGIDPSRRYARYQDLFADCPEADGVIIATPEREHFQPAMMALDSGYHVLLEKPIAQTYEECELIARRADELGLKVGVCHVLRFHPMFVRLKELVDSGRYGRIISINHTEEVGIDRATHSFVRGSMNREKENNPLLLAKCCHDLDYLLWLTGGECRRVSSFGSLSWFRSDNAPAGSAERCVDCGIERSCPYSAVDLYKRRRLWTAGFAPGSQSVTDTVIDRQLSSGPFGRCVFHCDNDVADNQVVTMQMADGMLITLDINFFTRRDCRSISIRLSHGEIKCDGMKIEARRFADSAPEIIDFSHLAGMKYHAGADLMLIDDFVGALLDPARELATSINGALEAHRVIFEAEKSRRSGQTVALDPRR